jgi:hypothetical protein
MRRIAPLAVAVMLVWAGTAIGQTQIPESFFPGAFQNVVLRNSFNPSGAGARGLGMGGAFIAVADDGTAASFNPAGLSQLRRSELAFVGFGDRLETSSELDGAPFNDPTSTDHGALDFGGLAIPFEVGGKNMTVQLSYQRSVDLFGEGDALILGANRGSDGELFLFDGGVNARQKGAFHTISFSTAYQVTQRLSLGATLNYWIADWNVTGASSFRASIPEENIPFTDVENRTFSQDQKYRALNMNFGILLKYPKLSLGGVVRLPFGSEYKLHETGNIDNVFEGTTPVDNSMRTTLHWPLSAGAGIAIRPVKGLTLAADYTATEWSRTYLESVPGGYLGTSSLHDAQGNPIETFVDRNFFDLEPASITETINTSIWRAGGEYLIVTPAIVIPLRGGLYRDKSPVPQFQGAARRIEGFTFGTGLNFDRIVLDVAYEQRKSEGDVGVGLGLLSGVNAPHEKVKEHRIVASLIYRFGSAGGEDPLKKFFHGIFAGPKEN